MAFWLFMYIVTLLIPGSLLLIWYMCPKFKKINLKSGYRSTRSMKNQDTWDFSQKYCSKISLYMFFPTLIVSLLIMPLQIHQSIGIIGLIGFVVTMIQMLSYIVVIVKTETELKKHFDENGMRFDH